MQLEYYRLVNEHAAGSAVNLNPHFHTLALDGVYEDSDGEPKFHLAPMHREGSACMRQPMSKQVTKMDSNACAAM